MALNLKKFVRQKGEHIVGVQSQHLTNMQLDGHCDSCGKFLRQNIRVMGKIVKLEKYDSLLGNPVMVSRFSPTCMECVNWN